jgi:uncharacterized protein YndB with AHSA1/START domain
MVRQYIDVHADSTATPGRVWELLADVATWAEWGPWQATQLDQPGKPLPHGLGAIRRLRRGRIVTVEEVVGFEPPRRLAYRLLSGLPLRDYQAEITLTPEPGGGTMIRWRSQFSGAVPLVGALMRPGLSRFIRDVAHRLARAAETADARTDSGG